MNLLTGSSFPSPAGWITKNKSQFVNVNVDKQCILTTPTTTKRIREKDTTCFPGVVNLWDHMAKAMGSTHVFPVECVGKIDITRFFGTWRMNNTSTRLENPYNSTSKSRLQISHLLVAPQDFAKCKMSNAIPTISITTRTHPKTSGYKTLQK